MTDGKLIDVAVALMKEIDTAKVDETPEARLARERLTASTMRRAGYSDGEIVSELGYLPEPFSA